MKLVDDLSKLREMGKKKEKHRLDIKSLIHIYKVFGRHYKKYWKILTVGYLSLFATIGVVVLAPWPLKVIIDNIILKKQLPESVGFLNPMLTNKPVQLLLLLSLSIVLLAVLEAVFSYLNKFLITSTGSRIIADIRERIFAHLQRLSLSFHGSARKGNLVYLLTSDIQKTKDILIDFPQDFTNRTVTFLAYAVMMMVLDWKLGVIALAIVPLYFVFTKYYGAGMRKAQKKRRKLESEVASVISENVTSMALVQAYGQEEAERVRFVKENEGSLTAKLQTLRLFKTYSRISSTLVTLSTAAVLYYGGKFALSATILPGTLVIFVTYLRDIYGTVENFTKLFLGLAKSQVSCERLVELVENDMVVKDDKKAVEAPEFKGKIRFENVSFAYKLGEYVLKDLNLTVEPGDTVALIGHSGAGKSTLISLILRFYDPQEGNIYIDDRNIRDFTIKSLRRQITILLQDAKLFRQSVKENIGFGKKDATDKEIIESAKLAEAHDFISEMPEEYETIMEEGGENLSGGQKQRINIARAIIRNTPIVILDEIGTGLDAKSEAKVHDAIARLTEGRTTFIIAHKLGTILDADKIILLENGELIRQGTHSELMETSAEYRKLYELQYGKYLKQSAKNQQVKED